MPACLPVCFCLCTLRSEEGITSPGAGVTYSCEQPDVHTETRTALLDLGAISVPGGDYSQLCAALNTELLKGISDLWVAPSPKRSHSELSQDVSESPLSRRTK